MIRLADTCKQKCGGGNRNTEAKGVGKYLLN